MLQGRTDTPTCPFTFKPKHNWVLQQVLFWDHQPLGRDGRILALLGPLLLTFRLMASLVRGPGHGSRQSFLGKPSPWEGGQAWSCGQGTCQAPGRASLSCHAPLQGISTAWKRSHCSFWLHRGTAGAQGTPQPGQQLPWALLGSGAQGRVGKGAGGARERPGRIISKTSPSTKPLPQLHPFQPSLPVTEWLLSGLVWIRN